MAQELPSFIDIRHLVDETAELRGSVAPQQLTRLPEPFRPVSPLDIELRLDARDERGIRVNGQLSTEVDAICQRCLNEMRLPIARAIDVVLVSEEPADAETEGDDDDFVVVENGHWRLTEFAEDELILACPMIPAHEQADCPVQLETTEVSDERRQPFAGLADLLAKDKRGAGD
jgi:uncharacterized protein